MLFNLRNFCSFFWIFYKHNLNEIFDLWTELYFLRKLNLFINDLLYSGFLCGILEGKLSCNQSIQYATNSPNILCWRCPNIFVLKNLWWQKICRTCFCYFRFSSSKKTSYTKINYFNFSTIFAYSEYILQLKIPMNYFLFVTIIYSRYYLLENVSGNIFTQLFFLF